MSDFLDALNKQNLEDQESLTVFKPFIGDPAFLSLAERQELVYKYQFLDETIEALATSYRLTPAALTTWFEEHSITPQSLNTPEEIAAFETHVNETYKGLRIRMSGLMVLQSAKAWDTLVRTQENLLTNLEQASEIHTTDPRTLSALVTAHNKLFDKHELLKEAIKVPASKDAEGFVDTITKTLTDLFDQIDGTSYVLPGEHKD